ncbi:MAG: hypothetical protein ACI84C_001956 [Flavobacteriales bacterium]|jgi:hypothetical protein
MKKVFAVFVVGIVGLVMIVALSTEQAVSYTSGAPEAKTGSPGDGAHCATSGCHANSPATPTGNEIVGLISNVPVSGYVPGTTYDFTATMSDPSISKFGFEVSPQNIDGDVLGTLIAGPQTGLVGLNGYVTHTFSFTTGPGTRTWDFSWTAPESGTGDVTFYGAFNFANNNNQTGGDVIVLLDSTVSEDIATYINDRPINAFNIYPNPIGNVFSVNGTQGSAQYHIFNLEGKMIQNGNVDGRSAIKIDRSKVKSGIYFIRVNDKDHDEISRVLIR